jgi:hypothetical protein
MATARLTGSAARLITDTELRMPCSAADRPGLLPRGWITAWDTAMIPAPAISHFSCWRRCPLDRRQLRTWATTNDSQNAGSNTVKTTVAAAYHPGRWARVT